MMHTPELDFALDRAVRRRWRSVIFALLGLGFGLQIGVAAWRLQSAEASRTALQAQHNQLAGKSARAANATLTDDQLKVATSAQAMLNGLAVPWEGLLVAIEEARTKQILVEAIQPQAQDGVVTISVSSENFSALAEFIARCSQQAKLVDVALVSETLPDNGTGSLRAVISAHWRNTP